MARDSHPANSQSASLGPRLSIRARLILLALLAVVPLMLDRVRLLEASRTERIELATAEVLDLARRGAEAQTEIVNSTRAMLHVVARAYVALTASGQPCNASLAGFAADIPWIKGFSVVGSNGRITCSTRPLAIGLDVSDRPYIEEARRSRSFVLSDYLIERGSKAPAIVAAFPAAAKDGAADAVILAPIDLQWFGRLSGYVENRPGASAVLLDGRGTVLTHYPRLDRVAGATFADHPLMQASGAKPEGTITTAGFDGVRRIFAYSKLPGIDARIAIGLDEREVISRTDREIGIAYLQLGLFGLLALLAAWFGGETLIVEPIRALVRTASRIGRGDLDARPAAEKYAAEFAPLAAALTDMAMKLAERERELRSTNRHLETLASIDGLSGLANRRSFDARLEAEWQRAQGLKRPVALMMIDVDHFKLFNDTYGHLEGDQCLRAIGQILKATAEGRADFVARYGGEEFVLLLPDADLAKALDVAERLRAAVTARELPHHLAPSGHVTVSIGVACLMPDEDTGPQDVIEAADAGLYEAKRRGRDTVCVESRALVPAA